MRKRLLIFSFLFNFSFIFAKSRSERDRAHEVDRADGAPGRAAAVVAERSGAGGRRRRAEDVEPQPPEALLRPVQHLHRLHIDVVLVHHHRPAGDGDARHHQRPRLPALRFPRLLSDFLHFCCCCCCYYVPVDGCCK